MLADTVQYLQSRQKQNSEFTWEILVMDDGSKDETSNVALLFAKEHHLSESQLRVERLEENRGKGGAVTQGVLRALGHRILFADADGATKFSDFDLLNQDLDRLMNEREEQDAIVIGSRAHMVKTDAVVKRSPLRNFLMRSFHLLVHTLGVGHIRDTQCGFKLFSRRAAQKIFPSVHVDGWIFDVEVLLLADMLNIPVMEIDVTWHEVDGSKMSLMRDAINMALDLLVIRVNYMLGIWRIKRTDRIVSPTSPSKPSFTNGRIH